MSSVFISYRRADSVLWSTKLSRHLGMRFGKDLVFRDVEDIKPGADFLETINQELHLCQVFLIVIGPHWLIDLQGRRRLDDQNDVLRMEITEALKSEATVLPVLVGGASMPLCDDLPECLKPLCRRQAISLQEDQWIDDVEMLTDHLREIILPFAEDISLPQASYELYEMQSRYFALLESGNAADALEMAQKTQTYLDRVLPLYPQDQELKMTRGYIYKNEAMALINLRRYKESESALNKGETVFHTMLDEKPRDASAWNGLGSIEAVRGNFEKAHKYVDEALKIQPDYKDAWNDHDEILRRLGEKTCEVFETLGNHRITKQ